MLVRAGLFGLCFLSFSIICQAQTQQTEVRASGVGGTESDALTDALSKAVGQINGAEVSADTHVSSVTAQGVVRNDQTGESESFSGGVRQSSSASFKAAGQVSDYKILSTSRDSAGIYHVAVLAHVASYKSPGDSDSRRRLAILPARSLAPSYDFYGPVGASELSSALTSSLESELVQTRRFSILDRMTLQDSFNELSLIGSDLTAPAEKAKLQKLKGADYLLIPTIRQASFSSTVHTLQSTGQVFRNDTAELAIELRVIVPATSEVKFSETYAISQPLGRQAMMDAVAHLASEDLTGRIFPLKVIAVSGPGEFVVNQGGRSILVGERYLIFESGPSLKDPYTGESLGGLESPVGKAEVERVDGKVAYLRMIDGGGSRLRPGLIARIDLQQSETDQVVSPPRPIASQQPGIRLPSDH